MLAGAVPCKIEARHFDALAGVPNIYRSVEDLGEQLLDLGPELMFDAARQHYLAQGTLGEHLARALARSELLADRSLGQVPAAEKEAGVTIFIPNWNHQSFLARSVASALASVQALEEAGHASEVIVVDDASRDGSQRLLRSIASHVGERRFGTVFLPTNLGLTGVRNLGLQLARYRNVLFLDADNELVPAAIPVLYRAFRMTEAALVYGNLIDIDRGKADALRSNEVARSRSRSTITSTPSRSSMPPKPWRSAATSPTGRSTIGRTGSSSSI